MVAQGDDNMENRCVSCGSVIPEGIMVCSNCLVGKKHIQTNYERILAMSLTELAEFICENTRECGECVGSSYCTACDGHANGIIKWLKKEVQTDGKTKED